MVPVRLREVKPFAPSHTADKWQSWGWNPGVWLQGPWSPHGPEESGISHFKVALIELGKFQLKAVSINLRKIKRQRTDRCMPGSLGSLTHWVRSGLSHKLRVGCCVITSTVPHPDPHAAAAAAAKSLQSCLTLCDPTDGSPPGSPVLGILQARTLEWVAISFSNA